MRKLIAALTALTIVAGTMPFEGGFVKDYSITASAEATSGTYGKNITWTLDDEGTLTISGTGATSNFQFEKFTDAKKIVIEPGVTTIAWGTFSGLENVEEVEIADTVEVIELNAFNGCSSLVSLYIPESVREIGDNAFNGCTNLAFISIPGSVEKIGSYAFSETAWLEKKQAADPLVIVNDIVIDGRKCEGDVAIPDGVKSISSSAFYNSVIESVYIPDTVTSMLK